MLIRSINFKVPITVAERAKSWVCGRSPVGTAGSNPVGEGGLDVCLLRVLSVVT